MIRANINDPDRASERKRAHYTNVATSEVFFESTPSVLIQITFVLTILSTHNIPAGQAEFKEIVNTDSDWSIFVFSTSFASSLISSAFGVSRSATLITHFLKMFLGPCCLEFAVQSLQLAIVKEPLGPVSFLSFLQHLRQ